MEVVGRIAVVLAAAVAVLAVVVGVKSIPDVRRYMKIRRM